MVNDCRNVAKACLIYPGRTLTSVRVGLGRGWGGWDLINFHGVTLDFSIGLVSSQFTVTECLSLYLYVLGELKKKKKKEPSCVTDSPSH